MGSFGENVDERCFEGYDIGIDFVGEIYIGYVISDGEYENDE